MKTRPVRRVPRSVLALLAAGLLAQSALRGPGGGPEARAGALPHPPARAVLRVAALGDPWLCARLLMLWLLTFERHAGAGVPLARLDYDVLRAWLARILELDPGYAAPLRAAVRVYAAVAAPEKKRTMLDFVHERFPEDPGRRWPWLVFAAIEARHRMGDGPLALRYARTLGEHAAGAGVPAWARDLGAGIVEDLEARAAAAREARAPDRERADARSGAAAAGAAAPGREPVGAPRMPWAGGPTDPVVPGGGEAAPGSSRSRDTGAATWFPEGRIDA